MILSGHDLTIGYSDRTVGHNLDVALATGEVLALLGPNGGGKTTLLKTLLGILPPLEGEALIEGRSLSAYSIRERARRIVPISCAPANELRKGRCAPCSRARSSRRCMGRRSRR